MSNSYKSGNGFLSLIKQKAYTVMERERSDNTDKTNSSVEGSKERILGRLE